MSSFILKINMNYLDIEFQWYDKGIMNNTPSGRISLRRFIDSVISPKPKMIEAFEAIKEAGERGNLKLKDKLKTKHLFFVTPSIIVNGVRKYEDIIEFLPFCVLEYDKIEYAEELKNYVFDNFDSCIFAFLSPSKTGCKFIFHIPVVKSVEEYKEYYFGLAYKLSMFRGLDMANQNCSLPLFCSYDVDALYREDAVVSTLRGFKTDGYVNSEKEPSIKEGDECSEEDRENCYSLLKHMINRIEDNGHPQIVKVGTTAGGLISNYNLDEDDLIEFLVGNIEENSYLCKNPRGYERTLKEMIRRGKANPIELLEKND